MIIHSHQTEHYHLLGGKANALAKLAMTGARIPAWFAVTSVSDAADMLAQADSLNAESFAVRSSALEEDGAEHSFAGQFDSFLYVKREELLEKIAAVFESGTSAHLDTYVGSKNIQNADSNKVTAIVQEMITPEISGVAFSADPVSGDLHQSIVSALWGTGSALVSGDADADTWTIKNNQIIEAILANKTHQHVAGNETSEGIQRVDVESGKQAIACLTDAQLLEITSLAKMCESHFGCPQDIEWAIAGKVLYLLQSRPITTLSCQQPEASEPLTVWDNSNIAESYSGITSPLTFSFAKRIYEHVYREFCLLLSVPKGRVKKHDAVFPEMLGHIHGHVYYNLNSWYHVLAMLPGFSINRTFMEQMMGVKVPMPEVVIEQIVKQTKTNKFYDALTLIRTVFGLVRNQIGLEKSIQKFYQRLETALSSNASPLNEMSSSELIQHYEELESKLLKRWDAPLVNDFFAMIYYGVLKSLCGKWLSDESLQNSLLLDCGDIVSAEPPRRIAEMAEMIRGNDTIIELLSNQDISSNDKMLEIKKHDNLDAALHAYLDKFGDRCLEELKLESPSVRDNAGSLLSSIAAMAKRKPVEFEEEKVDKSTPLEKLSGLKLKTFRWVLNHAKNRVRDRENLRFERTRLFGRVRQIMVEMGKRFVDTGQLENASDVFYLKLEEVMSGESTSYQTLVNQRKSEQESYQNQTPPPDRFHTVAPISEYTQFQSALPYSAPDGENLSGIGACPGIVRGKVRVVTDPRGASINEGEILVAQQTDPGWVVLFPASSGLLVERGSLLSHSAIVARELGLPCVVSIADVTKILKTGDLVEMNGKTGAVTLINDED